MTKPRPFVSINASLKTDILFMLSVSVVQKSIIQKTRREVSLYLMMGI